MNRITARLCFSGRSTIRLIEIFFRAGLFVFRMCGGATTVQLPLPCTELTLVFTYLLSLSLSIRRSPDKTRHPTTYSAVAL